jgi:hypothetical protein
VWRIRYNDGIYKIYEDFAPFNIHTFEETNVGWPHCKNGTTSYPKEGTRKLLRRKARSYRGMQPTCSGFGTGSL